ncbi:MAG: plasmid mobilization protein [Adhaeribacter sp.]
MMKEESNRTQRITIRLKPEEYSRIQGKFKTTTCRKFSEYARLALLGQQHKIIPHNQQLDEFMQEVIRLRTDLHGISNNFNQAVKKLHSLNQVAEFRIWLITWTNNKEKLDYSIKEIKCSINKMAEKWLQ